MKTENGEFTEFDKGIISRKCIMNAAAHSVGIDDSLFEQFFLEYVKRLEQAQKAYLVLDIK